MQYVINLKNLDLVELRRQRSWLVSQPSHENTEGLMNLLDHIADELDAKYDVQEQFMTTQARTEATKGMEAKVPEYFYKGRQPLAETVGDLLAILSQLPADLPIDMSFRRAAEVVVSNIGQADMTSSVRIAESENTNDALLSWECAKEEGADRYTRNGCYYCEQECHINYLLLGDKAENLCDGYQGDVDGIYEHDIEGSDDEEEEE